MQIFLIFTIFQSNIISRSIPIISPQLLKNLHNENKTVKSKSETQNTQFFHKLFFSNNNNTKDENKNTKESKKITS